jgi:hypothetical protein
MKKSDPVREHVVNLLKARGAHVDFDAAIAGLPPRLRGVRPEGAPYSAWELMEHIRIAQSDILEFSRNPKHVSPKWPEGYWPKKPAPANAAAWNKSVKEVRAGLKAMQALVADSKRDLFAPFPHGDGQTLLREALLVADHNAYHIGQLVLLRRLLGAYQ